MRKFLSIAFLFAAIAITATGLAGERVDAGPPAIEKATHLYDLEVVSLPELAMVPTGGPLPSYSPASVQLKSAFEAAPLFTLDRVRWCYTERLLHYDFDHWREHIKPLLHRPLSSERPYNLTT